MRSASGVSAFPTSQWSLIARAGADDPQQARSALSELCRRYWYPLYVFIRRQVGSRHDAEDVTQGFFAHLLEKEVFAAADPSRGRFRTYLLSCCKNFLANERRKKQAEKHGGGVVIEGLDFNEAAERYASEPSDPRDAEHLFMRRWAFTLLDETFSTLASEYAAGGQEKLFSRLRRTLSGDLDAPNYALIGEQVGMTEDAVKKAAQRLRARFAEELRRRIAETVDDPASVDDEIRALFAAVRSS